MRSTSRVPLGGWPVAVLLGLSAACVGTQPDLQTLIKQLESPKAPVRVEAARRIAAMGPVASEALTALADNFQDHRGEVHQAAEEAILAMGPEGVDALAALLSRHDSWVRCRAAEAIGRSGENAHRATAALIAVLDDHDFCVTEKATVALGIIGEPAAPGLLTLLGSSHADLRRNAANALAAMPPGVQEKAVAVLLPSLRSRDDFERGEAAGRIANLGELAIPVFLSALESDDLDLRLRALDGLEEIGDPRPVVVDGLMAALGDRAGIVRARAATVLGRLGQKDPSIQDRVGPLVHSGNPKIAYGAIQAIGNMGRAAQPSISRLQSVLEESPVARLREEAAESLMKIGTTEALDIAERYTRERYRE